MNLSVVIPVYNAEKNIERCLSSVLSNRVVSEIVVVNDGSVDKTANIVGEISKKDQRVHILTQKNSGPSVARKNGLKMIKGDYITFVDSDDYVKEKFYDQIELIGIDRNVDVIEFGWYEVLENPFECQMKEMKTEIYSGDCLYHYLKQKNTTNYLWNKIFKTDLFKNVLWENLYMGEDAVVLTQVFMRAHKCKVLGDCGYYYVQTKNSICRSRLSLRSFDNIKAYCVIRELLKKYNRRYFKFAEYKICSLCALMYAQCDNSLLQKDEIKKYKRYLKKEFKKARKNIDFRFIKENGSIQRQGMVLIFEVSPKLCSFLINNVLR